VGIRLAALFVFAIRATKAREAVYCRELFGSSWDDDPCLPMAPLGGRQAGGN
jgi:hypothetical protein